MAGLKIFISSTCYDLSILRSDLRTFISSLGYDPVMSDYADVVYDPRLHTHTSCVEEVSNCDMLIVIIGSRYGGTSVPEALKKVDISSVTDLMKKSDEKLSITQLEVIEALQNNIPVYTFIDKKVYYEHELYEKNKESAQNIFFPAIDKQETAKYIFEFINFLRLKSAGNFIFQFEKMKDIEDILKKQWSGYFQRLLSEQRHRTDEQKRMDVLSEQFNDLKTALLSSIESGNQRNVAKGIVNYRRVIELLLSLNITKKEILSNKNNFDNLLLELGITNIIDSRNIGLSINYMSPKLFFIKNDESFFECRIDMNKLTEIKNDWDDFIKETKEVKEIVYDTVKEMYSPRLSNCRYRSESFKEYINRYYERILPPTNDE